MINNLNSIDFFKFNFYELLLNVVFLLLVVIFISIIYWDNINKKVANTSRCKRQFELYNKNTNKYVINATDKDDNDLFKITYDIKEKKTDVECNCKKGNVINNFENIKVKGLKNNKDYRVNKSCSCDEYYDLGVNSKEVIYDGEPGILRYITSDYNDFFDDIEYRNY